MANKKRKKNENGLEKRQKCKMWNKTSGRILKIVVLLEMTNMTITAAYWPNKYIWLNEKNVPEELIYLIAIAKGRSTLTLYLKSRVGKRSESIKEMISDEGEKTATELVIS